MHPYHKILSILFIAIVASFLACNSSEINNSNTAKASFSPSEKLAKIPKLLTRAEKIQNGKEWESVQNQYGKYRQQILDDKQADEATLNLAQLFTLEARVTGEHGHYYPGALKLLNGLLEKEDLDNNLKFSVLATKAGVQLSQHDFAEALEAGKTAVELNPYNAQIYGVLTDAYVELGDYEKAVEMADKMVSIRPDLRSYSRVSYLREIHGMPEEAIEAMTMAADAGYPGYEETAWARLTLGELYEKYGRPEQAEEQYLRILSERKNYPFAIAALANIEMERGNYEKAEKLLKEACDIIPEVGYYEQLAHLYQETNREDEKNEIVKEIMVMLQDDIDSGHNMNIEYAYIYLDLKKNYNEALEYALKEYEKRPKNIDVNLLLAQIYHEKGDLGKTKGYLKNAKITNSKNPELLELNKIIDRN